MSQNTSVLQLEETVMVIKVITLSALSAMFLLKACSAQKEETGHFFYGFLAVLNMLWASYIGRKIFSAPVIFSSQKVEENSQKTAEEQESLLAQRDLNRLPTKVGM